MFQQSGGVTMKYYRLDTTDADYPAALAALGAAFAAEYPGNNLSVRLRLDGLQAIVKAPVGVSTGGAYISQYTNPPVALTAGADWTLPDAGE